MRLIECYIDNFGTLSDFKLSFSKGLNAIVKENGFGKTTLSVFIKVMLYGLDQTSKHKLEENDRKHYKPWQGGRFGGSLTYETSEGVYRIERSFGTKGADDTATLYDVRTGKVCPMPSIPLGEALFEIDADGFERTLFLSEANLSGKNDNKTVSAKISNLAGTEGDLSVMDDAIELLEKERRIYYKKGGTGLIGEYKDKISSITLRINSLIRQREEFSQKSAEADELNKNLEELYSLKKEAEKELRIENERRVKRAYIKQYSEMKKTLEKETEARDTASHFFKGEVPTQEKISKMKSSSERAKQLYASSREETRSESFKALSELFCVSLCDEEYEKADTRVKKIEENRLRERELLLSTEKETRREKTPTTNEKGKMPFIVATVFFLISGIISLALSNSSKVFVFLGVILLGLGIGLGVYLLAKRKSEAPVQNSGEENVGVGKAYAELVSENEALTGALIEFISHFPTATGDTLSAKVSDILQKRAIYLALSKRESEGMAKKLSEAKEAEALEDEVRKFLMNFECVTDAPFEEISRRVFEYEALCKSVVRIAKSIEEYANEHNLTDADTTTSLDTEITVKIDTGAIESEIKALEAKRVLYERQAEKDRDDLATIDELTVEKEELISTVKLFEGKLDIIVKTKTFLAEAKDSLTSKYLEKTKCAFDKYVGIIGKELGEEFTMDTSFAVMKSERGEYKPTEAYSRGTRDFLALAVRLALVDALYGEEKPFIVLDDPFAYFDDNRLKSGISLLHTLAKDRQIIYLTATETRI